MRSLPRPNLHEHSSLLYFLYFYFMKLSAGKILMSDASMDDPNFIGCIILITEYNDAGAMGLVINQQFEKPLNALAEFSQCPAFPLYAGGPVDKEHLFFIHRRPDLITDGDHITDELYFGGDFKQAIAHINQHTLDEAGIKICIGYCGWDKGELEAEIEEGSWRLEDANADLIFARNPSLYASD